MSKKLKDRYELAAQIVFEYENFGQEHISEMYQTYEESGDKPPCTFHELEDACYVIKRLKNEGLNFQDAVTRAVKEHK